MNHMQERLGSWQVGDDRDSGRASFRVFFPDEERGLAHNIDTIRVCGDFQHYLGGGDWQREMVRRAARAEVVAF